VNYWQVMAGSYSREYADAFLKFGLAFVGGDRHIRTIQDVAEDDRILLKQGNSHVVAVGRAVKRDGKVAGKDDKQWLRDFDGWDLAGYCNVEWHQLSKPRAVKGLTRVTIQGVNQRHLHFLAEDVLASVPATVSEPEPKLTKELTDEQIVESLIAIGLRPTAAEGLTEQFRRIRRLAHYYYYHSRWEDVREHETRTFLIIPLLLALGWSEQQIKIELTTVDRGRIDVACFKSPYSWNEEKQAANVEDCTLLLESADFSSGLNYKPGQVVRYAAGFPSCRVLFVSNGYCYKAYSRSAKGAFDMTRPTAYINITAPRDRYPLDPDHVAGALEAIRWLMPPR